MLDSRTRLKNIICRSDALIFCLVKLLLILSVSSVSLWSSDLICFDATLNPNEIGKVIQMVEKIDKLNIVKFAQEKRDSKITLEYPDGKTEYTKENNPDTLIVTTRTKEAGLLSGSGKYHYFKRINGKWVWVKTELWCS